MSRSHDRIPSSSAFWSCRTKRCNRVLTTFWLGSATRHHGLTETFLQHADELADRLNPERQLSLTRRLLLGATFTSEYAIEGAALCNPSMVIHPDQVGVTGGDVRFVMSVRAIGEGHNSSIGFRTGTISARPTFRLIPLQALQRRDGVTRYVWTPRLSEENSDGSVPASTTPTTSCVIWDLSSPPLSWRGDLAFSRITLPLESRRAGPSVRFAGSPSEVTAPSSTVIPR